MRTKTEWYFAMMIPVIEGGYGIIFPDFPEIASQGDTLDEALFMAQDALNITIGEYVRSRQKLPEPSSFVEANAALCAKVNDSGEFVDTSRQPFLQLFAAPKTDSTPVKVSISLPKRLLEDIDLKAKTLGMTRSGFLAAAAQAYENNMPF